MEKKARSTFAVCTKQRRIWDLFRGGGGGAKWEVSLGPLAAVLEDTLQNE